MTSLYARWPASAVVLALLLLLLNVSCAVYGASQAYTLERRVGQDGEWTSMATFAISRQTSQAPARIRAQTTPEMDLNTEQREQIATSDLIYYRAYPSSSEKRAPADTVVVTISPCSLIRGFDAVDSKTVLLTERLKVVPGPGTSLLGLQVSSETNVFHAKMQHGDECDRSVVQRLFPTVRLRAEVGLVHPVQVTQKVRYEDLRVLSEAVEDRNKKSGSKKTARSRNEDGEEVKEEEEAPVDDRSFLQKYWMYLVLPIVMSVIQNMKK